MGAVYLAEHPFMGRKAAIKVLRREFAEDRGLVERFMNEARAANAIRHPNIIDIIDVGRMPSGIPYLMMEFLDGMSLARRILERGQLPLREALEIAVQTTAALSAAHAKGIVHRDLKPDNLYLIADDMRPGGERVKVLDFGIAKLRGDLAAGSAKTQTGSLMGTPPYMSPEQCRGITDEIDERTDIYALGIILYEMLCGAPPFMSLGWGEIVLAHLTQVPPPPRSKNPQIPEVVEAVILKALAKSREQRFGSMAEMQAALRITDSLIAAGTTGAGGTMLQPPPAAPPQTASRSTTTTFQGAAGEVTPAREHLRRSAKGDVVSPRRWRRFALVAGGGAGALALVIVASMFSGRRQTRPPEAFTQRFAAAPAAPAAPAATTASAAAAPSPAAGEAPAPIAAPSRGRLKLDSEPTGALVTDVQKGTILGSTPFERPLERGSVPLALQITKVGFTTAELSVPLDGDFEKTVRLERALGGAQHEVARRVPARRAGASPRRAASSTMPASSTGAATAKATASSPPAPAPAPAKTRTVEKW
jgi:hypothetical protein